jgi:3-hydroxyacyl-[acyl-carrier-protein] dehydratase
MTIDVMRILKMIPHRYPFLLVDRIVEIKENESIVGLKNVTINESYFQGHFPAKPVMPGVLIIEAMAQTSAILVVQSLGSAFEGKLVYFMSIDKAKFRKPVEPGDQIKIKCKIVQGRKNVYILDCEAYVDDKMVAEATVKAMIADE